MSTPQETQQAYQENARRYSDHVDDTTESVFHHYYEKPAIRAELPDLNGADVISIGCGNGNDAAFLQEQGANRVVGVDLTSGLIDIAKERHPDIEFAVMDMEDLQFEDETFDFAYSSLAIEYVGNWVKALSEAYRVLKPGARYVFSCGHPIPTSMEYNNDEKTKTSTMGRIKDLEDNSVQVIGDYLAESDDRLRPKSGPLLEGMEVHSFHMPISEMVNQIVESGFVIKKMVEPKPDPKMAEVSPGHFEMLSKIPNFIIWVVEKPL